METLTPLFKKSSGGAAFSIAVLAYLISSVLFSLIIIASGLESGSDGYIYLSYLAAPVGIVAASAISLYTDKKPLKSVFKVRCKPQYYLIALLLAFGLLFSLGWLNEYIVRFIEFVYPAYERQQSYLPTLTGGLVVPAILVIAVLPAICEELLFRGVILNGIEDDVGSIKTIFLVGMCFSLFHASPEQTVYQFICGCVFAFIAIRSHSIMPSVVMHFLNNAVIIILYAAGAVGADGSLIISAGDNIALTIISAVSLIAGIVLLIIDKTPLKKGKKGGIINFFICAAVGIIILLVLWFGNLFGA